MNLRCSLIAAVAAVALLHAGCSSSDTAPPTAASSQTNASADTTTPLYEQKPAQIDAYLAELSRREPDFRARLLEIARRNLGQPYELYLLGEAPFETIDGQPVYNLEKSDCVVFTEHAIAMAMSDSFPEFLATLQRIRYDDGKIGVLTRNHYTEADWNKNNAWLAREITDEIGGDRVKRYPSNVDRAAFFKKRYKLATTMPVQKLTESYIPFQRIDEVKDQLRSGDIVNFVQGPSDTSAWVHHVGLVAVQPDGAVHIIHSAAPNVREEPIDAYIARATKNIDELDAQKKSRHRGFKFLRPVEDPMAALREVDGDAAPRVVVPTSSPVTFEAFVKGQIEK